MKVPRYATKSVKCLAHVFPPLGFATVSQPSVVAGVGSEFWPTIEKPLLGKRQAGLGSGPHTRVLTSPVDLLDRRSAEKGYESIGGKRVH